MRALLEVHNVTKNFGGLAAVSEVDMHVIESEIVGLIGPNGAGKSTLFNLISGFYRPSSGNILYNKHNITRMRAHKIADLGIGRAFQATTLFMKLSVFDNVFIGFHKGYQERTWKSFLHTPRARKEESLVREQVLEILNFMGLSGSKDMLAQNLPYGHQKILGVCIALATKPKLLLLDEPMAGMHPEETAIMASLIMRVRDSGVTIVLVEHNVDQVMRLCDRIIVLNQGKKIAEGLPKEIAHNQEVIEAYLGSDDEEVS